MLVSCLKEEVDADRINTGAVQIQLHNFNTPLSGGSLEGTAPDIYYFKQKEDGSYVFMLTHYTKSQGFATNWLTDYVLVEAGANGVIQNTTVRKLPSKGYSTPPFEQVWDTPPTGFNRLTGNHYVADKNGFLYYQQQSDCWCANMFFNLNPETGLYTNFSASVDSDPVKFFRTSDGGVISVGGWWTPDFEKHSSSGKLEFRQPLKYWETSPSLDYLMDKNGDYYFIALYNGPNWHYFDQPIENWFTENTAKSFFGFKLLLRLSKPPIIDWEIRFGPGKRQKAHQFHSFWEGGDYLDVPFEVWDLTNNRQLMVGFRDHDESGAFNLRPIKFNMNVIGNTNPWLLDPASHDPTVSGEWILVYPTLPYSTTPNKDVLTSAATPPNFLIWPYLAEGATWNPDDFPASSFSIKKETKPGPQLLKVNASGSTVVKDNFIIGTVPLKNIFKSVPYNDGSAILINAPSTSDYQPSQLVVLDANFNQKDAITMTSTPSDYGHQLEGSKDRVFYARITNTTDNTKEISNKGSLLLYTIRNGFSTERNLDEFIPFKLEKYRITPTKTGGVTIVAWVRPTKDTRDLLFFELDENLELVKR